MWSQRDQFLNTQIPIIDQDLILAQHELRQRNHSYGERAKYPCKMIPPEPELWVGDIVHLRCDLNKIKSRDRYLVVSIDYPWCNIRRFAGQQFRQSSYRVKISDCFKVPIIRNPAMLADKSDESSDEEPENYQPVLVSLLYQVSRKKYPASLSQTLALNLQVQQISTTLPSLLISNLIRSLKRIRTMKT